MPGNVVDKVDWAFWMASHVSRSSPSKGLKSLQPKQSAENLFAKSSATEASRDFGVESIAARGVINGKLPRNGLEIPPNYEKITKKAFSTYLIAIFYAPISH